MHAPLDPVARRRARRGMALPFALLLIVVLGAVAAGAYTASTQTYRGGRNALVEQRALAIAEYGLNQQVANWPTRLNLPASAGGLAQGQVDDSAVYVAAGDTARVRITRLTDMLYHVESFGRASIPNPMLTSMRSVSSIWRLAYPTITPRGAITAGGDVRIQGSALISGRDTVPYFGTSQAWSSAECNGLRGSDVAGVVAPPGASVDSTGNNIRASPKVVFDAAAADSNTYVRYGTESWNSLARSAKRLTPAQVGNGIAPSLDASGECDRNANLNWGEPYRAGGGYVAKCKSYFPIIYVDGDVDIQSNGRGQGILMINGSLRLRGNFEWVGLIIARDDVDRGNGSAIVTGAIMARNVTLSDGGSWWTGNQTVMYSKCALETVLRGSAILVQARDRSWSQLF